MRLKHRDDQRMVFNTVLDTAAFPGAWLAVLGVGGQLPIGMYLDHLPVGSLNLFQAPSAFTPSITGRMAVTGIIRQHYTVSIGLAAFKSFTRGRKILAGARRDLQFRQLPGFQVGAETFEQGILLAQHRADA